MNENDNDQYEIEYNATHQIGRKLMEKYDATRENDIHICINDTEMKDVVSRQPFVVLQIRRDCYCYERELAPYCLLVFGSKKVPSVITVEKCVKAIMKDKKYKGCNHYYLETIRPANSRGECEVFFGN